jgi:ankyrin repeat protein
LKMAIACGGDVDAPVNGQSPVFWAAGNGNYEMTRILLAAGAKIDGRSKFGRAILVEPVAKGDSNVVTLLLNSGAGPDIQGKSGTPLIFEAAKNGHRKVVSALIAAGCDITVTSGGDTPMPVLMPAIQRNDEKMTRILLAGGASIKAEYKGEDMYWHAKKLGYKQLYTVLKAWKNK